MIGFDVQGLEEIAAFAAIGIVFLAVALRLFREAFGIEAEWFADGDDCGYG